ncbi:MAG: hypothetical protein P8127_04270 [Acidobacteriota bacterium]
MRTDSLTVGGEARVGGKRRRRGNRLGLATRPPRLLVNRDPPQVHATATVTDEVDVATVR